MAIREASRRPGAKPGPKPGWSNRLRDDLANYKEEAEFLRGRYLTVVGQRATLAQRITNFNCMGFWAKVLFLLKGGKV